MPAAAANAADDQGVASSRMSYSRFLVRLRPSTTVSDDTLAVCEQARRDPKTRARFRPKESRFIFARFFSFEKKRDTANPNAPLTALFPSFASL